MKGLLGPAVVGYSLVLLCWTSVALDGQQHFSTLQGTTIRMQPSGASFQVPAEWPRSEHTLHLTKAELGKVRTGTKEWDTEYAAVVNAALPFEDCSVHAGGEGWGAQGASFGDLQMRGYVSRRSSVEIENNITKSGFAAARKLPLRTASGAALHKDEIRQWHRIAISYNLAYSDYGGKANVEFYVAAHEGWTVVLVFMHADTGEQGPTIRQIVQSFSWQ